MTPRSTRLTVASAAALLLVAASASSRVPAAAQDQETVGAKPRARTVTPVNQIVTPVGLHLTLPGMRPQALALSPDGTLLAVAGKTHSLLVVHAATGRILQQVVLPARPRRSSIPRSCRR